MRGVVAAEGCAVDLEVVDAVLLFVAGDGVGEIAAVVAACQAEELAVGGDLHADPASRRQPQLTMAVSADRAKPQAQPAAGAAQCRSQIREAIREALRIDPPEVLEIVPRIVENERIQMQTIMLNQDSLEFRRPLQRVR